MAKRKKGLVPEDQHMGNGALFNYMKGAYRSYGHYVLEQRAVVDFRDGLKPVQRRVLWAANEMGLSGTKAVSKKSAAIVGEVMGKYHPHGDKSIYDAMVLMTRGCSATMIGIGGFGSQMDNASAPRYTEAHLSRYSDLVLFDKRYLAVTEMVDTYDGSNREPLVLPSILPNLLINGSYGLAVGATNGIPAFHPEGVIALTKKALQGEDITAEDCLSHMEPRSPEGGLAFLEDEEAQDELLRFFETGRGSVYWYPEADLNTSDASVLIKGFAPSHAKSLKRSLDRALMDDRVSGYDDETIVAKSGKQTELAYRITLKNTVEDADIEEVLYAVTKHFEVKQSLSFSVTERLPPPEDSPDPDVRFQYMNMPEFFRRWAEWRTQLELRAIQHELDQNAKRLHIVEGLTIAFRNLSEVIRIIRREDEPKQQLMQRFELTEAQTESILNMRLRQLAKLEKAKLDAERKELLATRKRLRKSYKDPVPDMVGGINELSKQLDKIKPGQ